MLYTAFDAIEAVICGSPGNYVLFIAHRFAGLEEFVILNVSDKKYN